MVPIFMEDFNKLTKLYIHIKVLLGSVGHVAILAHTMRVREDSQFILELLPGLLLLAHGMFDYPCVQSQVIFRLDVKAVVDHIIVVSGCLRHDSLRGVGQVLDDGLQSSL